MTTKDELELDDLSIDDPRRREVIEEDRPTERYAIDRLLSSESLRLPLKKRGKEQESEEGGKADAHN